MRRIRRRLAHPAPERVVLERRDFDAAGRNGREAPRRVLRELQHPVDKHSQRLITDAIALLLDYCMRFYDRQFITRHKANSDVLSTFEQHLSAYLRSDLPQRLGLPTVAYFADKACLSNGYFGDLIK